jgi:hypothetical protein
VPDVGQTGSGHEAYVPGPDDGDLHRASVPESRRD